MVLFRRSFKYSLPLRDKLHALRFVASYRRLNRGIYFNAGMVFNSSNGF